jgi:anti-anti-sigma factor
VSDVRYFRKVAGGAPVVAAPAEIDVTGVGQLRAVLLHSAARGHHTVVVDMAGTADCDSSGLQTLSRARKRAVSACGQLRLVVPQDGAVCRVLDLTGLGLFWPCFSSLAQALAPAPASAIQPSQAR